MKDNFTTAGEIGDNLTMIEEKVYKKGLRVIKVIRLIAKHYLKEISEQIRIYKDMESAGVLDDLPNPLKTKEYKRYSELKKDSKVLKEYLDGV